MVHTAESLWLSPGFAWAEIWAKEDHVPTREDKTARFGGFALPGSGAGYFTHDVCPPMERPAEMHATDTIDFVTVVSAEIEWWSRTDRPCEMTVVMTGVEHRRD
jgi:hypothetical protein